MTRITRRECLKTTGTGLALCALTSIYSGSARAHEKRTPDGGMIIIPAGSFLMGTTPVQAAQLAQLLGYDISWFDGELPQRAIHLPTFAIDRYPITNQEYGLFCATTQYPEPPYWRQPGGGPPLDILNHPVTGVNKSDALAYASWVGKRLPTEAEWEKAARGPGGLTFPWGSQWDPGACRWNRLGVTSGPWTSPVTTHPNGASPFGVMHMVGNVAEWCEGTPGSPLVSALKGGSGINTEVFNLRPAARNMSPASSNRNLFYGFRCAKNVS